MLFSICCFDKANSQQLRLKLRSTHIEYMMQFRDKLLLLGPLLSVSESTDALMVGSLIVIDLPDVAAVETFLSSDPYGQAGLFETVTVHLFRPLVCSNMESNGQTKRMLE